MKRLALSALVALALSSCSGRVESPPAFTPEPGNMLENPSFEEPGRGGAEENQAGVGRAWETVCGGPHPEVYCIDETCAHSGLRSQKMRSDAPYNYDISAPLSGRFCYDVDEDGGAHRHPRVASLGGQAIAQATPRGSVAPGVRYRAGVWVKAKGLLDDWEWLRLGFCWLDAGGNVLAEVRQEKPARGVLPTAGWHLVTCEGVAPEGASSARVYLHHGFVNGTVWFDDAYFVAVAGE